jgi:hypothetical protein
MRSGLIQHLLLTLRLNTRSKQALVYGYLVPIFFLFAFAALFRWDTPPLLARMGQLLTISTLGGACFGMPTGMVGERERGVWRRYRLLPGGTRGLITSTLIARFILIASGAILQIILAWLVYRTPFPAHPLALIGVFVFVAFSFEGMGLVIAAVADNVPAVQALGQAVFLPVIMIGGVGVPLANLPNWAQTVAGFLPGRYAVEALQPCFDGTPHVGFQLLALSVIGIAGCVAGGKLFRWDAHQRPAPAAKLWVFFALMSWIAVGAVAASTGRLKPVTAATSPSRPSHRHASTQPEPWDKITSEQLDSFVYTGLLPDDGTITPVAPSSTDLSFPEQKDRMDKFLQQLDAWPPGHLDDDGQSVRNLLSVAVIADYTQDPLEGQIARAVFERLKSDFDPTELEHILAWIITSPDQGTVLQAVPELGLAGPVNEDTIRSRSATYALKLLGRLLGKLPDVAAPQAGSSRAEERSSRRGMV